MKFPNLSLERKLAGIACGIDEAGRGPLAGPVVAAAIVLDHSRRPPKGINDSKKLNAEKREELYYKLMESAQVGVGEATVEEIDRHNILQATLLAMHRAYMALGCTPDHALVDGNRPPKLDCTIHTIVKGDGRSLSIAAASIIAKVTRDRIMHQMAVEFPHYGFERHVGYGTADHLRALAQHGPCVHHRRSFAPVRVVHEQLSLVIA